MITKRSQKQKIKLSNFNSDSMHWPKKYNLKTTYLYGVLNIIIWFAKTEALGLIKHR